LILFSFSWISGIGVNIQPAHQEGDADVDSRTPCRDHECQPKGNQGDGRYKEVEPPHAGDDGPFHVMGEQPPSHRMFQAQQMEKPDEKKIHGKEG